MVPLVSPVVEDGEFNPERLANKFCSGYIYVFGGTVKELIRWRKSCIAWER
ncbi:MAG: hypothetical protein ACOX87_15910 [Chloroflexota bacterium]